MKSIRGAVLCEVLDLFSHDLVGPFLFLINGIAANFHTMTLKQLFLQNVHLNIFSPFLVCARQHYVDAAFLIFP